jgi:hypothetical protein
MPEDSPTPPVVPCNHLYIVDAREETFGKSTADKEPPTPTPVAFRFYWFCRQKESQRADLRTADLLQLRVIIHALQGLARVCRSRISKPFSFLCLAACCTVLRSRWYQSGINITVPSGLHGGGHEGSRIRTSEISSSVQVGGCQGEGNGSGEHGSGGLSGRADSSKPSIHDLGSEAAGVEVGHEAAHLAALYLQDAHALIGDGVSV